MDSRCGLSPRVIAEMNEIFRSCSNLESALLFGSRACGNYKKTSDIDLAVTGCNFSDILRLQESFADSNIIYTVDVVDYNKASQELRDDIDEEGIIIFSRKGY